MLVIQALAIRVVAVSEGATKGTAAVVVVVFVGVGTVAPGCSLPRSKITNFSRNGNNRPKISFSTFLSQDFYIFSFFAIYRQENISFNFFVIFRQEKISFV